VRRHAGFALAAYLCRAGDESGQHRRLRAVAGLKSASPGPVLRLVDEQVVAVRCQRDYAPDGAVIVIILSSQRLSPPAPDWPGLVAAATVLGLSGQAYRLARAGRPVVGPWLLFTVIMVTNGVMHQTLWN
jgi:hypothetical protein